MRKRYAISRLLIVSLATGFSGMTPALALTPLRSPEQLAQDQILFARASVSIAAEVQKCFLAPPESQRMPIRVRFFVSDAGQRVSQLQILEPRPGQTAMQVSSFRAITACAPYVVIDELKNWGGFWATITFR